jgi:hypothetical protein
MGWITIKPWLDSREEQETLISSTSVQTSFGAHPACYSTGTPCKVTKSPSFNNVTQIDTEKHDSSHTTFRIPFAEEDDYIRP